MKNALFLSTLMLLLFASCETTSTSEAAAGEQVDEAAVAAEASLDIFVDAINTGDFSQLEEAITADFARVSNGTVEATGPEGFKEAIGVFQNGFPDLKVTISKFDYDDGNANIQWTFAGTHNGIFGDLAPTGRSVMVNGMTYATYDGSGKITKEEMYFDMLGFYRQLGMEFAELAPAAEEE